MLKIGDTAFDTNAGVNVQILERIEAWGFVSYRVFNPVMGKVYKVAEADLSIAGSDIHYDENYIRYVTLLSKIKNETAGGLLSSLASGVIPLPHQLHVLNRALAHNTIRYILADEVGLGKTIEAGMVIRELKARGLIRRTLVVCPTGLVSQWAAEMQDKFHEKFQVILPSDFDTIRRMTDSDDVYGQYDQIISPMDSIKPLEKRVGWSEEKIKKYNEERVYSIINSGWDLIIIDEAHRVAGSSASVSRYKLGSLLADSSPYILLLSATPHSGKTEPFLRLVRLLDKDAFPNAKSIVKEQVAPFLIRTEKREAIDNNGNRLFKNRITHLVLLNWDERHSLQRQLYEMVTDYVAKTYNKALRNRKKNMCLIFLLIIMQRMVTSSTAAIRRGLERRLAVLKSQETKLSTLSEKDLLELNIEDDVEEALAAMSLDNNREVTELEHIISVAKQAEYQYQDAKVEKLLNIVDSLLAADSNQKIIIFTEFVATQEYLKGLLCGKGRSVSILNGSLSIEERNIALREFRDKSNIFISTDAGGEGLNLQFSNIIINYDLPWNPMKIEQRCGRADRIGQTRDVEIYNFIIEDTIENRVREVLEEKLSVIFEEMGVDKYSDVMDGEAAEIDFTEAYMRSISHPQKLEDALRPIEADVKEQMENTKKYKDVIHEDKDLGELVGKESNFDVDDALHRLIGYYDSWKGNQFDSFEHIGINDEKITRHLNAEILHDSKSPLLSVRIDDFPNEPGYFMLWILSITDSKSDVRIIPIFLNDAFVLRPIAGKKIMDVFLDDSSVLHTAQIGIVEDDVLKRLEEKSKEFAYDTFCDMKDKYLKKNRESYDKYIYALKIRTEAAEQIGIENIKQSRLKRLERERETIEANYTKGKNVFPDFRLIMLVHLEE